MELFRKIMQFLATIGVLVTLVTAYLSWNATWSVKHERAVSRGISLTSSVLGLTTCLGQAVYNGMDGNWLPSADYGIYVIVTAFNVMVALGWWVPGERQKGIWGMLKERLGYERKHVGDLAKALVLPASADKIIEILGALAMLDDNLDDTEKEFIDRFARAWNVSIDFDDLKSRGKANKSSKFNALHSLVESYLKTSPPPEQVLQLDDVIQQLINADGQVSKEEEFMSQEISGLLQRYAKQDAEQVIFEVVIVPQNEDQRTVIPLLIQELQRRVAAGGDVFVSGPYFSKQYATMKARQFQTFNFFSAVIEKGGTEPLGLSLMPPPMSKAPPPVEPTTEQ